MKALMTARRAVASAKRQEDETAEGAARKAVDVAKQALGERGWSDGAPDYNRCLVHTTPYAGWFAGLPVADAEAGEVGMAADGYEPASGERG